MEESVRHWTNGTGYCLYNITHLPWSITPDELGAGPSVLADHSSDLRVRSTVSRIHGVSPVSRCSCERLVATCLDVSQ